jgi:hypothetical protein
MTFYVLVWLEWVERRELGLLCVEAAFWLIYGISIEVSVLEGLLV